MNVPIRLLAAAGLVLACALSVPAQGPDTQPQGASQPWMQFEKQLGLQTTYSCDMVMQSMGMSMNSRIVRDGGKTRSEMTMPFMNIPMVVIDVPQGGKSASYTLFPAKKKYVLNDSEAAAAMVEAAAASMPKIEDLGTETYEGETCLKRRVTMVQDGVRSDMTMLLSPRQKNMPVKMTATTSAPMAPGQPAMPVQSAILFKNYSFSTPDPALFAIPSDYVQAASMQEIMMEGMDLGAMMQQLQQMQPPEE